MRHVARSRTVLRQCTWALVLVAATLAPTLLSTEPAAAQPGNVWSVDCSAPDLVTAFDQADASAASSTINLSAGCAYTFSTPDNTSAEGPNALPVVTVPLTINGNGATLRRSTAGTTPDFRLLQIGTTGGNLPVVIRDLTIAGGAVGPGPGGGGIQDLSTGLTLTDDTISDNAAAWCGGGVDANNGGLTVTASTFTGNQQTATAYVYPACGSGNNVGGAALWLGGNTLIADTTISGNVSGLGASAISGGGNGLGDGAFQGAQPGGGGNGITLLDDTITGNQAPPHLLATNEAATIWSTTEMRIENDTIVGNTGGPTLSDAGLNEVDSAQYWVWGSIIEGNCVEWGGLEPQSLGSNVIGPGPNGTCQMLPYRGSSEASLYCPLAGCGPDVTGVTSFGLGPLAANGGPTETEAISSASPGYHLEPAANCAAADQRGVPRPQPPTTVQGSTAFCDAGAYELAPPVVTAVSPACAAGNTPMTLSGYGLTLATAVTVGEHPVPFTVTSDSSIDITAPLGLCPAPVVVTNPDGLALVSPPPVDPPSAPAHLTASASSGAVDLSWSAPTSEGGSPITGYDVYEGTTSGGESSTPVNPAPLAASATSSTVSGLTNGTTYYFMVKAINAAGSSPASNQASATPVSPTPPVTTSSGYWLVAADGGVFSFGDARFSGSEPGIAASARTSTPVVGIAATANGKGYWEVTSTGRVFAFGDAHLYGSMAGKSLDKPVVGIATTNNLTGRSSPAGTAS